MVGLVHRAVWIWCWTLILTSLVTAVSKSGPIDEEEEKSLDAAAQAFLKRYQQDEEGPQVADDILQEVKRPRSHKSAYRKSRRQGQLHSKAAARRKMDDNADDQREEAPADIDPKRMQRIEKLIPEDLKVLAEESEKNIIKTMLRPITTMTFQMKKSLLPAELVPEKPQKKEAAAGLGERMRDAMAGHRAVVASLAPTFAPDNVTKFVVNNAIVFFSSTVAWILLGTIYNAISSRGFESRSHHEPWEEMTPESSTVAQVLRGLAHMADQWHDEL